MIPLALKFPFFISSFDKCNFSDSINVLKKRKLLRLALKGSIIFFALDSFILTNLLISVQ